MFFFESSKTISYGKKFVENFQCYSYGVYADYVFNSFFNFILIFHFFEFFCELNNRLFTSVFYIFLMQIIKFLSRQFFFLKSSLIWSLIQSTCVWDIYGHMCPIPMLLFLIICYNKSHLIDLFSCCKHV